MELWDVAAALDANFVRFGRGQAQQAITEIAAIGDPLLVVSGANRDRAAWLEQGLRAAGVRVQRLSVASEPDVAKIEAARQDARHVMGVVGIGGGAVIDAAKALAALIPSRRPSLDHLEVVGLGKPLDVPPLPFVAIPTTSGTGAEVTYNAVLMVPEAQRKVSLRDPAMVPDLAIVDPALTDQCPASITLASGLDAITQVIEPFISTRATPETDAICVDAIPLGLRALPDLMTRESAELRDQMAWVSLCGGLALSRAGLGVVHGLAGPLGGLSGAAHGAICGALLPWGLAINAQRCGDPIVVHKIRTIQGWIAEALGGEPADAFDTLHKWSRTAGLPGLSGLGVTPLDQRIAAQMAVSSSSMKANPATLSQADLEWVQNRAR